MTEAVSKSTFNSTSLPTNEVERLRALRRYGILDTPPEVAFDRITSLAARLFEVPIALVSLVDESRVWFKSCHGFDQSEIPRNASICSFTVLSNNILVVPDTHQDERFANNSCVQGDPGVRFYVSAPLLTQDGFNLGTLSLVDTKPRASLTDDQKATLTDLAAMVMDELELRLAGAMRMAAEQERQQAEKMQQDAAQRLHLYADVVRNVQVGIVVWQLENLDDPGSFRLVVANSAASEATGFDFEPVIGKTMAESFPKLLHTPLAQQYLEVVHTGRSLDLGEVSYGEDGISTGIYSLKAFPLPDHCLGLAFENITARKKIEIQLQESQHFNQQIAEAMPGVLFVHDLIQNQNIYTNRQIADLLGYTSEQVQAMGANAIATLVHPDDLQHVSTYFEALHTASDDAVLGIEYRAHHANGSWCWLYTQSVVFNRTADGSPRQVLGVSIDINHRKQSEQALQESEAWKRLVTQVAQLGGWRLHLDTNLVELDERMRQIWGEPDDAVMLPLSNVLKRMYPSDRERVASAINAALDPTSLGAYEIEYRIMWDDGTQRWILAKGQALFEGEGMSRRVVDFFGTALDITDRKRAEEALAEQEQRYRYIFEAVSMAIWEEDFSEAKAAIDHLKATGIHDFHQYFAEHPEFVQQMASSVRIQDVNQAALKMFGAQEKAELLASLDRIFVPETQAAFTEELLAIAHEETFVAAETVVQTLQGDRLTIWFTITFPPASEPYDHVLVSLLDITQRKQAETALQASEERLSLALRSAQAGMWQWFKADNRMIWSDETFRMLGYEPGECLPAHENWVRVVHPDDREIAEQAVKRTLDDNCSLYSEYRVCLPDGSIHWLADIGQVTSDEQGNQTGTIGIQIDISQRKQIELEHERSEAILNAFLKASPIALTLFDPNLRFVYVNEALAQINGLPLSEHFGRTLSEVIPDIAPQFAPMLRQIMETQEPVLNLEYSGEVRPGVYRHTIANHFPVCLPDGEVLGVGVTITDISELKRVEAELRQHSERLNLLYETTRELLSAQQPLELMNHLFEKLSAQMDLHYYYHFKLSQQNDQHQLHLANYGGLTQEQADAFATIEIGQAMCGLVAQERHQIVLNQSEIAAHSNAEELHVMGVSAYAGQPLMVQGRLLGTLSFASLTRTYFTSEEADLLQSVCEQVAIAIERANLITSIQQQAERLQEANRIKDEFLAVLSHELRSPLNPILGWTRLLQNGNLNETRQREALATIERNAKLQKQLIEDLLDISRIMQGKLTLTAEPVSLTYVISGAVETVRLAAEAKHIQIVLDFNAEVAPVSGDAARLQQVVWNLLTNAVKFTPSGGQVTVELRQLDQLAQIRVCDTGKGISPDFLPHVFEYFRQADSTTTRKFGGLGLGLAIVRQIVEMHGGTVRAESLGENQGATFIVQLPIMQQTISTVPEPPQLQAESIEAPLSNLQILVVDDDDDTREFQAFLLEQQGAKVITVASGLAALHMLDQFVPDVIVSDVGMPEMDGYTLMQKIRSRLPNQGGLIPAIALTAYASELDQQKALLSGFQTHIAKPVEPGVLVEAIAKLLNQTYSSLT
jgi:PAS domain S-box-containing protein